MKIVILGGGTAGWLSALIIGKTHGDKHEITLIESPEIKSIGVGEGSTGFLRGIVNNEDYDFGCNEIEFMKKCKATPKLGVYFKDWILDKEYLEPIDSSQLQNNFDPESLLTYYVANDIPIHLASINGRMSEYKISSFARYNNEIVNSQSHAYHFDAALAGQYFKEKSINFTNFIESTVKDVVFKNKSKDIDFLILENNEKIFGDFFIDASGFSRTLSSRMGVPYIQYKDLTLNSAIPFQISLTQMKNDFFYTKSWAQKYGWMWMIPKSDHIACGYIYNDNFINEDQAKSEIEKKLNLKIDVKRKIKFSAGRLKTFWNNNVISVGLSSGFLEPLEATSIHGTIAQINLFNYFYLNDSFEETMKDENIKKYNDQISSMFENFKSFILLHYYNVRQDTPFWKNMNDNAKNDKEIKEIIKISENRLLNSYDTKTNSIYGASPYNLFNWVLCGLGHFSKESAKKEIMIFNRKNMAKKSENDICNFIEKNKDLWLSNDQFLEILKG